MTWQCPASRSQDTGVPFQAQPLSVCVCICAMKVCLTEQEVRQTDMSLTLNILQTLSSRLYCTGCVTHTFHIPVDVKASQAAHSHTCFLERWAALVCWSNPGWRPFSHRPLFTHSVSVHIYKQFIVLPVSSGTSRREETQTRGAFWKFFPHFLQ